MVMVDEKTDAAVIAASRAQPYHFAEIFDRHFDAISRHLVRRVGRPLADDLAAETFVEAFRSRARYDEAYVNARPWLYGIARNLLRHHRREEHRRLIAYARMPANVTAQDESEGAISRADAAAVAPRVALALASIPSSDRDVLLLLAWEQLSYAEIAVAVGVPIGTVRSRLNRARTRVRELLGPVGQYLSEDDVVPLAEGGTNDG